MIGQDKSKHFLVLLVVLFVAALQVPLAGLFEMSEHNYQRWVQAFFLVLIAISGLAPSFHHRFTASLQWLGPVFLSGIFLFLIGGAVSVSVNGKAYAALEYLHWLLLLFVLTSCIGVAPYVARYALGCFLFLHMLSVMVGVLNCSFALFSGNSLWAQIVYPNNGNIRFFNQIQVLAIPLLLFFLPLKRFQVWVALLIAAEFFLLFIGGARGACLTLVLVAVLVGQCRQWRRQFYILVSAAAAAGVLYWLSLRWGFDGIQDLTRSGSSGRVAMWSALLRELDWRYLFYGAGPGSYTLFSGNLQLGHPHNAILQILYEWGGLALCGLLTSVAVMMHRALVYVRGRPLDGFAFSVFLSLVAALAYAMVDGVIVMPVSQSMLIILAGLLMGLVAAGPQQVASPLAPVRRVPFSLAGKGGLCLVLAVYMRLIEHEYFVRPTRVYDWDMVRFWVPGEPVVESILGAIFY